MKRRRTKNLIVGILVFFSLTVCLSLFPQYGYYYGKNKVLQESFDWKFIETPHFDIYYYTTDMELVNKIARVAEYGYNRISNYLNVKVDRRIPLIYYNTHIELEQTNISRSVAQSTVAFSQLVSYRVVLQGDASFDSLARTLIHELGHIFEFECMGKRRLRFSAPPLWIMEGFSEFMAETWEDFSLLTVRDSVLNERVPQLQRNGDIYSPYASGRTAYDFGHSMYEFLDEIEGRRGIKKLLLSLKRGSFFSGSRNPLAIFDLTPKIFNYEYGKYLRKKFRKYLLKENPEDYSYVIGPEFPFEYAFAHQISPSGEMLATLTVDRQKGGLTLILLSLEDGRTIKKITPGFTSQYDNITLRFDPTDGSSFTWNADNNTIAFFARKALTNYLVLVNILDGKVIKKLKIKDIQVPTSPDFLPGKDVIYFVGQESTYAHVYSIDLKTGETRQLTDNTLFVRALNISADGKKIVYSARKKDYLKLYVAPIEAPGQGKRITSGAFNDITPAFSLDGKHIYYSSSELGSFNINSIDLEKKLQHRYTDVRTGNFFPLEVPGEDKQVVISSYYKSSFKLYKKDVAMSVEQKDIDFNDIDRTPPAKIAVLKGKPFEIKEGGKYKPLKKIFLKSLPPVSVGVASDGAFVGFSSLSLSDLMGDHSFSLMLSTYYGFRSYHVSYLNQKNRLQLYARLYATKDVYYSYKDTYYNYIGRQDYQTLRKMYGGEVGFFYPFSREMRAEATVSVYHQEDNYAEELGGGELPYSQFFTGNAVPIRLSLTAETTRFNGRFGPVRGATFKVSYQKFIKFGDSFLDGYAVTADFRKYLPLSNSTLFAFRLSGTKAGGEFPPLYWTGGNNTFRSADYRRLTGNNAFLFNAEFRFPLVRAALTPIGVIGPIRGVVFFDFGGVWFNNQDYKFRVFKEGEDFRLQDAISSFGYGVQFVLMGYPMHLEWVWRTDFTQKSYQGINFWMGFDF